MVETVPQALVRTMAERRVGRNGWAVMTFLCKTVLSDGRLGAVPAPVSAGSKRNQRKYL